MTEAEKIRIADTIELHGLGKWMGTIFPEVPVVQAQTADGRKTVEAMEAEAQRLEDLESVERITQ